MRATIKNIAELAGVSIGTVDRVLHQRPYVKAEVKARVVQAMKELEYHPNRMAAALATSGTPRRFVLLLPQLGGYVGEELLAGVAKFQAERTDYNLHVETWEYLQNQSENCVALLDRLLADPPQGVALCAADDSAVRARVAALTEKGVPVVTLNSDLPGARRLCFVGEDAHRAGRIAGEIAAKFCRPDDPILVTYAGTAYEQHRARADGFLERIEERGLSRAQCRLAQTRNDYAQTFQVVSQALAQTPNLRYIYMANWSVTACVDALQIAGKLGNIPVICHDNTPEIRAFLHSGAVDFTIEQDLRSQSWRALELLFDGVVNHKLPETEFFYLPSPILNGENC